MAESLVQFLAQNQIEGLTKEVNIGGRLKDFTFKVKPISQGQFNNYQNICTTIGKNGKSAKFNNGKFNELVIINHVVDPNFRSTEVLATVNASTPEEYINKVFLAGEIVQLGEKISELSGFGVTDEELEIEVKNS